ncbi:DUF6883 domain-containing protein [Altericista sp. CCNU0014]|uniref:DUF6883 domain-containing protein n=1 Tax=Altericista sp. CCNU0014 TaxID=3082949 RepID=UPI00385082A1
MRIPDRASIPDEKLTRYLLIYRARNDKSKFLAQAGFTAQNVESLRTAIRALSQSSEAVEDRTNEYGTFYEVTGELMGNNGKTLFVTTLWLRRQSDGEFQFITLIPAKEPRSDA